MLMRVWMVLLHLYWNLGRVRRAMIWLVHIQNVIHQHRQICARHCVMVAG